MIDRISRRLHPAPHALRSPVPPPDPGGGCRAVVHVVIPDGTISSLLPGRETNAGLTFRLLREGGRILRMSLYDEPGIQWTCWTQTWDLIRGRSRDRTQCDPSLSPLPDRAGCARRARLCRRPLP
ncbi:MAG: hypothetical protein ACK5PT_21360 [Cereibacter sp.]